MHTRTRAHARQHKSKHTHTQTHTHPARRCAVHLAQGRAALKPKPGMRRRTLRASASGSLPPPHLISAGLATTIALHDPQRSTLGSSSSPTDVANRAGNSRCKGAPMGVTTTPVCSDALNRSVRTFPAEPHIQCTRDHRQSVPYRTRAPVQPANGCHRAGAQIAGNRSRMHNWITRERKGEVKRTHLFEYVTLPAPWKRTACVMPSPSNLACRDMTQHSALTRCERPTHQWYGVNGS